MKYANTVNFSEITGNKVMFALNYRIILITNFNK